MPHDSMASRAKKTHAPAPAPASPPAPAPGLSPGPPPGGAPAAGDGTGRIEDWSALLVDDSYFPYFLDYAVSGQSNGLGDIILFLLGADRLRFSANANQLDTSGCMEAMDVAESYMRVHPNLQDLTPLPRLAQLGELCACRVPLVATLAAPCDLIWREYERRLGRIYTDNSAAGNPLKKKIIDNEELSLLTIVSSAEWKRYFEQFIRADRGMWACYSSWRLAVTNIENIRYSRARLID
jgi:hypothetical protein